MNNDNTKKNGHSIFEDVPVNVKLKLSALWAALMFVYVYVDIFGFFKPGVIDDILIGRVSVFDITQGWALGGLVLLTIPSLMVFLSLSLPAKLNRRLNIIFSIFYIIVSISNSIGEIWYFIWLGSFVETILLLFTLWYAWNWPLIGELTN